MTFEEEVTLMRDAIKMGVQVQLACTRRFNVQIYYDQKVKGCLPLEVQSAKQIRFPTIRRTSSFVSTPQSRANKGSTVTSLKSVSGDSKQRTGFSLKRKSSAFDLADGDDIQYEHTASPSMRNRISTATSLQRADENDYVGAERRLVTRVLTDKLQPLAPRHDEEHAQQNRFDPMDSKSDIISVTAKSHVGQFPVLKFRKSTSNLSDYFGTTQPVNKNTTLEEQHGPSESPEGDTIEKELKMKDGLRPQAPENPGEVRRRPKAAYEDQSEGYESLAKALFAKASSSDTQGESVMSTLLGKRRRTLGVRRSSSSVTSMASEYSNPKEPQIQDMATLSKQRNSHSLDAANELLRIGRDIEAVDPKYSLATDDESVSKESKKSKADRHSERTEAQSDEKSPTRLLAAQTSAHAKIEDSIESQVVFGTSKPGEDRDGLSFLQTVTLSTPNRICDGTIVDIPADLQFPTEQQVDENETQLETALSVPNISSALNPNVPDDEPLKSPSACFVSQQQDPSILQELNDLEQLNAVNCESTLLTQGTLLKSNHSVKPPDEKDSERSEGGAFSIANDLLHQPETEIDDASATNRDAEQTDLVEPELNFSPTTSKGVALQQTLPCRYFNLVEEVSANLSANSFVDSNSEKIKSLSEQKHRKKKSVKNLFDFIESDDDADFEETIVDESAAKKSSPVKGGNGSNSINEKELGAVQSFKPKLDIIGDLFGNSTPDAKTSLFESLGDLGMFSDHEQQTANDLFEEISQFVDSDVNVMKRINRK
ncbi:hypothetical protein HDU97_003345 [Phlyctochytrium planicorne]|nr:hypothetical protein HDU97_003345 [Phlyctochytrium planicorne]